MNSNIANYEVFNLETFSQFIELLRNDLIEHPEQWENRTLDAFLEAMSGYAVDVQSYYVNTKQDIDPNIASWKVFKDILIGSTMQE